MKSTFWVLSFLGICLFTGWLLACSGRHTELSSAATSVALGNTEAFSNVSSHNFGVFQAAPSTLEQAGTVAKRCSMILEWVLAAAVLKALNAFACYFTAPSTAAEWEAMKNSAPRRAGLIMMLRAWDLHPQKWAAGLRAVVFGAIETRYSRDLRRPGDR